MMLIHNRENPPNTLSSQLARANLQSKYVPGGTRIKKQSN